MRKLWMFGLKRFCMAAIAILLIIAVAFLYGEREAALTAASAQPLLAAPSTSSPEDEAPADRNVGRGVSAVHQLQELAVQSKQEKVVTASLVAVSSSSATAKATSAQDEKIVYLTFDDGPSKLTDQVLSILKEEKATATFFVLGEHAKQSPELIQRMKEAGHAIGNHTYNHEYDDLYSSFPRFWDQIKRTEEVVREITGVRPAMVRAPGGTYGHFDETYFKLMEQGGYKVFDWDVDSGDSKRRGVPAAEIVKNATSEKLKDEMIVLLHDGTGHEESVKALPEIIKFYKKHGYTFRALSPDQKPVQFNLAAASKIKTKPAPSRAWIESHIEPNAALFGPGEPLYVEAGGVATKLAAGEYELADGQYMVPLRSTMERLGAKVSWDGQSQSAVIVWGDATVIVEPQKGTLVSQGVNVSSPLAPVQFSRKNDSLWISLRPLLEATGHPIVSFESGEEERRVKAM